MSFIFLYLMKPFVKINLCIKALPIVCSNAWMMHHNICGFINFTCKMSLMARKSQQIDIWIWSFQNVTCVCIHASSKILTSYMLPKCKGYKCTFFNFWNWKDKHLNGVNWCILINSTHTLNNTKFVFFSHWKYTNSFHHKNKKHAHLVKKNMIATSISSYQY